MLISHKKKVHRKASPKKHRIDPHAVYNHLPFTSDDGLFCLDISNSLKQIRNALRSFIRSKYRLNIQRTPPALSIAGEVLLYAVNYTRMYIHLPRENRI